VNRKSCDVLEYRDVNQKLSPENGDHEELILDLL
jgi:hypothetical protein